MHLLSWPFLDHVWGSEVVTLVLVLSEEVDRVALFGRGLLSWVVRRLLSFPLATALYEAPCVPGGVGMRSRDLREVELVEDAGETLDLANC